MAFSPDENYILTGSDDNTAVLWNLNGDIIQRFQGHLGPVLSVAFSVDGKKILTSSFGKPFKILDLYGTQIQNIQDIELTFIRANLKELRGNPNQEFQAHSDSVLSVAFSPNGKYILSGGKDKTAKLWDFRGQEIMNFKGHLNSINSVVFSPDGNYALTGSEDKMAKLWNLKGELIRNFQGHKNSITSVEFSPDGKYILTGSSDNTAKLWDLNGNIIREFQGHYSGVQSVTFSADGKYILTGSNDNTAKLWDLNGNVIQEFQGHYGGVQSVAFSPDGKYILTGSEDNTAKLWNLNGRLIKTFKGHFSAILSVAFSMDGSYILTGSKDNSIKVWDAINIDAVYPLQSTKGGRCVVFSPTGDTLLAGCGNSFGLFYNLPARMTKDKIPPIPLEQKDNLGIPWTPEEYTQNSNPVKLQEYAFWLYSGANNYTFKVIDKTQLLQARALYEKLGHEWWVERIDKLLKKE